MEYNLYLNNNNYFLITNKAINFSIALEFKTFNNKIISNEELEKYSLVEFNEENLNIVLKYLNIDLNDIKHNNYIKINNKIFKFNNWLDVFNYSTGRY